MIKIYTAPIAGVTDYTYRGILKEFKPDLLFTEMVSINALEVACEKTLKVILRLREGDSVQLFGKDIKKMVESAKFVESLGVKHIDINSGCPMKKIIINGLLRKVVYDTESKTYTKTIKLKWKKKK